MSDVALENLEALVGERFRKLFERAPFLYVLTNNQAGAAVVGHCNPLFLSALGYTMDDVVGRPLRRFCTGVSATEPEQGGCQGDLEDHFGLEERQLVRKDGSVMETLLCAVPRLDAAGEVVGAHALFTDMTARELAQEALRRSEERYRNLVEHISEFAWEMDREARYTYCSPRVLHILGYEPKELLGRTPLDLMVPAEAARVKLVFEEAVAAGAPIELLEHRSRHRDGREVVIQCSCTPVVDARGEVTGYRGIGRDVTEQSRAVEAVRVAQDYTQGLISSSLDMIISADELRRIVEFNPAAEETFGYEKGEVVGKHVDLLYADSAEGEKVHRRVRETGRFTGEVSNRRKDGVVFPSFLSAAEMRGSDGNLLGVMGISRDITTQKKAEQDARTKLALQRLRNEILRMESEQDWHRVARMFDEELGALVDYTRWSVSVVDSRLGTVTQYFENADEFRVVGKDKVAPAIQKAMETGSYVYRRNREEMAQMQDHPKLVEMGIQSALDVPFSSGTIAVSSLRREAFTEDDLRVLEEFAGALSEAHRRIEDLKALSYKEQQLRQAQKLESVGQLASGVAHELNNPLTVVLGQAELMLRRDLSPADHNSAELITKSALRAKEISERLLRFARRQAVERQRQPLNPLVHETAQMVRHQLEVRNVRIVEELAEGLPEIEIHSGQVQQVILNLLRNSGDGIKDGGQDGTIWLRTFHQRDSLVLEVEDDGVGIQAGEEDKVFEPFYTTKAPGEGTGLGLSVSHTIVRDHGGHLYARQKEGGACLAMRLPVGHGIDEKEGETWTQTNS